MRYLVAYLLLLPLTISTARAQISVAALPKQLLTEPWPARWIAVPGATANAYGVYHFRKTMRLATKPRSFVVHVSGDNRYKLYVNGQLAGLGPARGDVQHWAFETIDIGPLLTVGQNSLAAVVWNFGDQSPYAQHSFRTGFIVQGNGPNEQIVNTNQSWKCLHNKAYTPLPTDLHTFFQVGPGDDLLFEKYPWHWESANYDDSNWPAAREQMPGSMWNLNIGYDTWTLTPCPIPAMELTPERITRLRRAEGIRVPVGFPRQATPVLIPAHTKAVLLLDQTHLTTAYPVLTVSGGRAARITLAYAESLFLPATGTQAFPVHKANRDSIAGKVFVGYRDRFVADGGQQRTISPLWWRTYRYLELTVETKNNPLIINDLSEIFTAYPLPKQSTFQVAQSTEMDSMLAIGWRTARLCANETYMDCPYYEQLQYAGDVRIQALVSLYNSPDDRLVRNAITQLRQSLAPNGLTMSRYPSREPQYIPTFSLWWIGMLHDYWMYRGDRAFVQANLPATRLLLNYFAEKQQPNGSLSRFPDWPFTDWTKSPDWQVWGSVAPYTETGNSAPLDLQLLLAYQTAGALETQLGMADYAHQYADQAARMAQTIRQLYWDEQRQLFADTPQKTHFSQHANILAVLANVVTGDSARQLMEHTLADMTLVQPSIFYRYYLHRAVAQAGLGDRYLDLLGLWRAQMALGLTTWAESHEPSRSDCHAWGASPNIEFYRIVLGIDTDAPGFGRVRIAPHLGALRQVGGSMPHPKGTISVRYDLDTSGTLQAQISLPAGVEGVFRWKGQERTLISGTQRLTVLGL